MVPSLVGRPAVHAAPRAGRPQIAGEFLHVLVLPAIPVRPVRRRSRGCGTRWTSSGRGRDWPGDAFSRGGTSPMGVQCNSLPIYTHLYAVILPHPGATCHRGRPVPTSWPGARRVRHRSRWRLCLPGIGWESSRRYTRPLTALLEALPATAAALRAVIRHRGDVRRADGLHHRSGVRFTGTV